MTATVKSAIQLKNAIASGLVANGINRITGPYLLDILDDIPDSVFSCYAALINQGVTKSILTTIGLNEFISAIDGTTTPWSIADTHNSVLVADPTTGRIYCPSPEAAGTYLYIYDMKIKPNTAPTGPVAAFPLALPEKMTLNLALNGSTYFGTPSELFFEPKREVYLPIPATVISGALITAYVGGTKDKWIAESLAIMSPNNVTGSVDKYQNIQVTNLGPTGLGSPSGLFASAKTTDGFALTSGIVRSFAFDQAGNYTNIAANDVLRIDISASGHPAPLGLVAVRGSHALPVSIETVNEDLMGSFGIGFVAMVSGDYVSLRQTLAVGTGVVDVKAGTLLGVRI